MGRAHTDRPRRGARGRRLQRWAPAAWLGPSLLLILAVILFPAIEMVNTSLQSMDIVGVSHGYVGLDNYRRLFAEPALGQVMTNTVLWVIVVVGVTVVASLGLAQFLNKRFAGRRLVRWALIVPWAASLVMTATVWRYILEGSYGVLNRFLIDLGILTEPIDWYKEQDLAFWCLVAIGIIVSIPFTTYVILAGLQALPQDVYEAARVDGAGSWRTYISITLPLLRSALLVAVVLNVIYVFNSFPLIWTITGNVPGNDTDTAITYAYRIAFKVQFDTGEAAALSVLNVALLLVVVLVYLRLVRGHGRMPHAGGSPLARLGTAITWLLRQLIRPLRLAAGKLPRQRQRTRSHASRPAAKAWQRFGMPVAGGLIAAFFLAPYVIMFLSSLKSDDDLLATPANYLPEQWMWSNWADAWNAIPLMSYLRVSLTIAISTTALVMLVAIPAAYYSARHNFRAKRAYLNLVLITQMFAPVALVVGIYREVLLVGGVGTYWAIVLVDAAFNLAFAIWILNAYFASIPQEIEEAAMLDGLGRLRTLLRVVLPMAKPGVVTAVVFTFIQTWNEFVIALTLFNDPLSGRQPLTVGVQQFIGLAQIDYQSLFVAALVTIVPVVVLFVLIERHLVAGLTAGSVK